MKKNMNYQPYSQQEDQLIISTIKNYPNNLTLAFEQAGEIIGRNPQAVSQRYYTKLKKDFDIIAVGSDQGLCINTKNTPRNDDTIIVETAMVLFSKMTKAQKIQFITKVF